MTKYPSGNERDPFAHAYIVGQESSRPKFHYEAPNEAKETTTAWRRLQIGRNAITQFFKAEGDYYGKFPRKKRGLWTPERRRRGGVAPERVFMPTNTSDKSATLPASQVQPWNSEEAFSAPRQNLAPTVLGDKQETPQVVAHERLAEAVIVRPEASQAPVTTAVETSSSSEYAQEVPGRLPLDNMGKPRPNQLGELAPWLHPAHAPGSHPYIKKDS